jgi:hypothetical protein
MITLQLNDEEQQALIDILECSISEIHSEIVHTERYELKECLKGRRQVMLKLLDELRKAPVSA